MLMKIGNVSQSVIPVPDFFYTRSLKPMDTFNITQYNKRYFRPNDLFNKTQDINLGNNYRNRDRKYEEYNKKSTRIIKPKPIPTQTIKNNDSEDSDINAIIYPKTIKIEKPNLEAQKNSIALNKLFEEKKSDIKFNIESLLTNLNKKFNHKSCPVETINYETISNRENINKLKIDNENELFKKTLIQKIGNLSIVADKKKCQIFRHLSNDKVSTLPALGVRSLDFKNTCSTSLKNRPQFPKMSFYSNKDGVGVRKDKLYKEKKVDFIDMTKYNSSQARKHYYEDYENKNFMSNNIS
jgi:hypothetical protein